MPCCPDTIYKTFDPVVDMGADQSNLSGIALCELLKNSFNAVSNSEWIFQFSPTLHL